MNIRHTIVVFAIAALCAGTAIAQTGSDPTTRANRMAYDSAMKCFIANGHAAGERRRVGDLAKASYYEAKGKEAFDVAVDAGKALGYSGQTVDADFGLTETRELPSMVKDDAYFLRTVATCKALGLM